MRTYHNGSGCAPLLSPNGLLRLAWKRDSLQPGDTITIEGCGARDGWTQVNTRSVTRADGTKISAGDSLQGGAVAWRPLVAAVDNETVEAFLPDTDLIEYICEENDRLLEPVGERVAIARSATAWR
jgi:hypothetical protein